MASCIHLITFSLTLILIQQISASLVHNSMTRLRVKRQSGGGGSGSSSEQITSETMKEYANDCKSSTSSNRLFGQGTEWTRQFKYDSAGKITGVPDYLACLDLCYYEKEDVLDDGLPSTDKYNEFVNKMAPAMKKTYAKYSSALKTCMEMEDNERPNIPMFTSNGQSSNLRTSFGEYRLENCKQAFDIDICMNRILHKGMTDKVAMAHTLKYIGVQASSSSAER